MCLYFFSTGFFLPAIARRGPFLVRALVCVRWPRTGRFLRWRPPRYDVHQPLDVHRDFRAERAFHFVVPFDHLAQPGDLGVAQIAHPRVRADARLRENLDRVAGTDAEDVRKCVLDFFIARQIHACNTSHASP